MRVSIIICFILFCLSKTVTIFSDELVVIYPPKQNEKDTRNDDLIEILQLALEKTVSTHGAFKLKPCATKMNEARCREQLKVGKDINIIWTTVTEETEKDLYSIKIPLRKGILGYRVFLINKKDADKFKAIKSVDELKKLTVGQDQSWNDVAVFKTNGFKIETGPSYEGMFSMLMSGRFDYFSRGINEAKDELDARKDTYPDMMIEESILLYYHWPKFYYFNKNDMAMADRVEKGLRIMIADGSLEKIFVKYNQQDIDELNLKNRKLFKIDNPLLPESVKKIPADLWYDPLK